MSTNERIILDPGEVAGNRTALDITPWVKQDGADWGDAQITSFMADRDRGSFPVDFSIPNRDISIPLRFSTTQGGTTTTQARANIQAKIGLFQREGGWIKRVLNTGGVYYADIVDGSTLGFSSTAGFESGQNADIDPAISLSCLPDFYQDEVTLGDHTETTAAELIFTQTSIDGDYPARVRVVVDDDQGADQRGLIWAFRSRQYDAASTARLTYEAETLGPISPAAGTTGFLASSGSIMFHNSLATSWTPVMNTNIGGATFLTHKGTYRVYARVGSSSGTTVQTRLVWDVGDLVNPVLNDAWRVPDSGNFFIRDYGEIRLDPSPVGTHRWQGQIQAKGDVGGENISIDKIWLVPVDEGMGVLTAPTPGSWGATSFIARDEFNQSAGNGTGKVLPIGGTWTVAGTACDSTDFVMDTTFHTLTRTAVSDSGTGANVMVGRGISAGATSYAPVSLGLSLYSTSAAAGGHNMGLYARLVDTSNFVICVVTPFDTSTLSSGYVSALFGVYKVKAGVVSVLRTQTTFFFVNNWYRMNFGITASGQFLASLAAPNVQSTTSAEELAALGLTSAAVLSGSDTDLTTGGTLETGKLGIIDMYSSATPAASRVYDDFTLITSPTDAVIFANHSAQLTSDGHYRLDSGGTAYGPVGVQVGDLPRLPVAGLEGRTTEVFLKPSRGDFNQLPDTHAGSDYGDNMSARIFYRPCFLNVGDS